MYTIIPSQRFRRSYQRLTLRVQTQVDDTLELLSDNPHHPSLRVHKRRGEKEVWQARVTRSYRLYFRLESDTVTLIDVGAHEK